MSELPADVERGFSGFSEDDPLRDFMATYFDRDDEVTRGQVLDFLDRIVDRYSKATTPDDRDREVERIAAVIDSELHVDTQHGFPMGYTAFDFAAALYDAGLRASGRLLVGEE